MAVPVSPDHLDLVARQCRLPGLQCEGRVAGGATSDKWLLRAGDSRYLLRVDRPLARALGLDRHREYRIMQTLVAAGLITSPVWADPEAGLLLRPYIAGVTWRIADFRNAAGLGWLGRCMGQLHALTPIGSPMDLREVAHRYACIATTSASRRLEQAVLQALDDLHYVATGRSICHNDVVAGNVLRTAREPAVLIDYEYAAPGDRRYDLAVVAEHHGLDAALACALLDAYNLHAKQELVTQAELHAWRGVYRGVRDLWQLACAAAAPAAAG